MLKKLSVFIFGERLQSHLPERVRESIAQQQCESEKFISWVQLLLVVTFGILYALAPSSAPEARVQPVPWILSAYFIFTMVRLIGSHRGQLPNWLLMASVVMDMVLLTVATVRAQRVLNRAVLETTAAEDLSRFVSAEVADRITSVDRAIQPGDGESKVAMVLFTDIEGFSTISENLTP